NWSFIYLIRVGNPPFSWRWGPTPSARAQGCHALAVAYAPDPDCDIFSSAPTPRGAPVPFQGLSTTEYDEACGSCGKRVLCVFQGAVGAFLASTAPAASTGSPVRTARAGTFTTTDLSSADRSGAPTGPCALSAWGGSVPRPERP